MCQHRNTDIDIVSCLGEGALYKKIPYNGSAISCIPLNASLIFWLPCFLLGVVPCCNTTGGITKTSCTNLSITAPGFLVFLWISAWSSHLPCFLSGVLHYCSTTGGIRGSIVGGIIGRITGERARTRGTSYGIEVHWLISLASEGGGLKSASPHPKRTVFFSSRLKAPLDGHTHGPYPPKAKTPTPTTIIEKNKIQ